MNAEEEAYIENELKATTVGYINKKWTVPPTGTHWKNALDALSKAKRSFFVCVVGNRKTGEKLYAETTEL